MSPLALWPILIADARNEHEEHYAPSTGDLNCIAEIRENLEMVEMNCDDMDSDAAKLINLAAVVAACNRYARDLQSRIDAEDVVRLMRECA